MPGALELLEFAHVAVRASRGDPEARDQLVREGLPAAAEWLAPGSSPYVTKTLALLRDLQPGALGEPPAGAAEAAEDAAEPAYSRFVRRLLAQRFGFYVVVGEPGSGKTTLALRLASRLAAERGYQVVAVGGLHPDDRRRWQTDGWVESAPAEEFLRAMDAVGEAMVDGAEYPIGLKRRVLLLDDASLLAHTSQQRLGRALLRLWNVYRHLDWVAVLTARTFRSITTVAEGADARFLKRPVWEALVRERDEARAWWQAAEDAYRALRGTADWQTDPHEQHWVYVDAPALHYKGMLPYGGPAALVPREEE